MSLPYEPSVADRLWAAIQDLWNRSNDELIALRQDTRTDKVSPEFSAALIDFIDLILRRRDEDVREQIFREHMHDNPDGSRAA